MQSRGERSTSFAPFSAKIQQILTICAKSGRTKHLVRPVSAKIRKILTICAKLGRTKHLVRPVSAHIQPTPDENHEQGANESPRSPLVTLMPLSTAAPAAHAARAGCSPSLRPGATSAQPQSCQPLTPRSCRPSLQLMRLAPLQCAHFSILTFFGTPNVV